MKKPFAVFGVVCLALAGCAAESAENEDIEAESAISPLNENRQPKLELRLDDPVTHEWAPPPKVLCPTANLFAVATLRGESFSKTVAEMIVADATSGWSRVIASYPIGKEGPLGSLPLVPNQVSIQGKLGDLAAFDGHAMSIQIVQKRLNGKVVGESAKLPLRFSRPRVDLLSVTRSTSCPMTGANGCYVASLWLHPSDTSVPAADYACDSLRLALGYRKSEDGSYFGSYVNELRPTLLRADAPAAAITEPYPWPEAPSTAHVLRGNDLVSNTVSLP